MDLNNLDPKFYALFKTENNMTNQTKENFVLLLIKRRYLFLGIPGIEVRVTPSNLEAVIPYTILQNKGSVIFYREGGGALEIF